MDEKNSRAAVGPRTADMIEMYECVYFQHTCAPSFIIWATPGGFGTDNAILIHRFSSVLQINTKINLKNARELRKFEFDLIEKI